MASSRKVFSLEGKGLKLDTAADLEPHIAELRSTDVEEVKFLGNTLGVGACKLLGEVLATKNNLQSADLSDIFTGRLLSEIPEALTSLLTSILNLPKLTTINLNDNAFGINTQAPVVAFLAAHVPLQHLYLNNNGLGPHAGILVANALSELHAKKEEARKEGREVPYLETVICGRNRLENGSMQAWAKAFSLHNKIKEIKMVQNGIRQEGISHLISEGLNHATELRILDLQDNTFTVSGAKAVASVLPTWTHLQELGLNDAYLTAKGTALIAKALAKGKQDKLEILRLAFNDITPKALTGIASAVSNSLPALKKVELNGNKFEEEDPSVIAIREQLEERKEKIGGDVVDEDAWGLDSLSDLEGEESGEEEEEESEEEEEEELEPAKRAEVLVKEAEEAQEEPTVQLKDKEVDDLAKKLGKTEI
ncbi:ran GTPase activating protein 1 [Colletotrichum tofieldiae]|uniref:Ran GTPase activating protein 1 n=1 Tax=Colletotrichum tofieldiae TaxID=708197 RepID=A0A166S360_9PEZI|nr:Ran GTPase activating protein 1 [Colletotrichum tofieldiae]GKT54948.1 Ran GTPase activating protein 1 [Colletotrichum tofieldiae]GKT75770.1 ran GTPase activating protein 1 [Colletotrichum tofieldiae]GKT83465.1 ran GTPase activating protein 1 [Colletotrichum tofieldiae]